MADCLVGAWCLVVVYLELTFCTGVLGVTCTCPSGYTGNGFGPNGCVSGGSTTGACASNPCQNGACTVSLGFFFCVQNSLASVPSLFL